jgi:hypothetical protein
LNILFFRDTTYSDPSEWGALCRSMSPNFNVPNGSLLQP